MSETGIATYLQILITWLIFIVGIPIAAFQTFIEPDVRSVAKDRLGKTSLIVAIGSTLLVSILLVWMLQEPPPNPSFAQESLTDVEDGNQRNNPDSRQSTGMQVPQSPVRDYKSYLVPFTVTVAIVLPVFAATLMVGRLSRKAVIGRLERELSRSLKKRGFLERASLIRLIYLGTRGKAGEQKKMVFDALDRLSKTAQTEQRYSGEELELLITGLGTITSNDLQPGGDEDFWRAEQILKSILSRHSFSLTPSQLDASVAIATFRRLGTAASRNQSEPTALAYLADAAQYDVSLLFDIGLSAFRTERFLIATAALNKLESMHLDGVGHNSVNTGKQALVGDVTPNLLGLVAHFMTLGLSTRKRSEAWLNRNLDSFTPNLEACLENALEYHFSKGAYQTSDKLAILCRDIKNKT